MRESHRKVREARGGSALVFALLFVVVLSGLAASVVGVQLHASRERRAIQREIVLQYVAEAGLAEALGRARTGAEAAIGSPGDLADFGGSAYYVEDFDLGSNVHRLVATALDGRYQSSIETVVAYPSSGFPFPRAITARALVRVQGNALIDSYDPAKGTYAAQLGVSDHVGTLGDIATDGSVTVASNTEIYGSITYGPDPEDGATVSKSSSVSGGQSPAKDYLAFPAIEVPALTSKGDLTVSGGITPLGPGDLRFDSLDVASGATLAIVGPARVVLDEFTLNGGGTFLVDASAGEIEIYVAGKFNLQSNSTCAAVAADASAVSVNLLAVHDYEFDSTPLVTLSSNANFVGTIYAPGAHVIVDSNFEMYGALVANWVQIRSNTLFHFDESLLRAGGTPAGKMKVLAWRPLSPAQALRFRAGYSNDL